MTTSFNINSVSNQTRELIIVNLQAIYISSQLELDNDDSAFPRDMIVVLRHLQESVRSPVTWLWSALSGRV